MSPANSLKPTAISVVDEITMCGKKKRLVDAFAYLEKLQQEGILSGEVMGTLRRLTAQGEFDAILEEARGVPLTRRERQALRAMES